MRPSISKLPISKPDGLVRRTMGATTAGFPVRKKSMSRWGTHISTCGLPPLYDCNSLAASHYAYFFFQCAHKADTDSPPNHGIFKAKGNTGNLAPPSLLQRRLAANQSAAPASPVINNNFTFPDGFVELLRPAHAPVPVPTAGPSSLPAPALTSVQQLMLLPPGTTVGDRLSIGTFCQLYDLDASIAEKFGNNGYRNTSVFYLIKLEELTTMNFLPGEIAELRDAVRLWALPS